MALSCTMCKTAITNKQRLTCRICEKHFHLDCTDITFARFRLMTPDNKKAFRCQHCLSDLYSSGPNKSPLLPIKKPKPKRRISINLDTSSSSDSSLPSPIENCTIRPICHENVIVNIPTTNSFQELCHENEVYASITSTPVRNTSTRMEELREKICRLEKKLETAEHNIEKLTEKNRLLEIQVADYINKNKHEAKNKDLLQKLNEMNTLQEKQNILPTEEHNASATKKYNSKDEIKFISKTNENHLKNPQSAPKEDSAKKSKHIYVIGDNHLRGLSSTLLRTRFNKWNDVYQPDAYIMPGATSKELLTQCERLSTQIKDGDVVVLGIGNNDNDIHKLHSNLCIALSKLCKAKIFITPIIKNMYLNENTLNYHIMLWTKHFENCTFINSNSYNFNDTKHIHYICKKINSCIDYNRYESDFLHFEFTKKNFSKTSVLKPTQDDKKQSEDTPPMKGTIPYYFKKRTLTQTYSQHHTPKPTNKSVLAFQSQNQTCLPSVQQDNNKKTHQFFRLSTK